jgi:hypothetical protein
MKRFLYVVLAFVALTGCGPSKTEIARSQVNELADTWDGGAKFTPEGTDPWGEPYAAKVEKGDAYYVLTVRSNGPDRLPQSGDDIVAMRMHKHTPLSEAAAPAVEKLGAALGKGLGRGGVAGVKEGLTGKKPDEKGDGKKPDEKKGEARKE